MQSRPLALSLDIAILTVFRPNALLTRRSPMFTFKHRAGALLLGAAVCAIGLMIADANAANKVRKLGDQSCSCLCGGTEVLGSDGVACSTFNGSACKSGNTTSTFESCKKCTVDKDGKCVINVSDPLRPTRPKNRRDTERSPTDTAPASPGTPAKPAKPMPDTTAPRSNQSSPN